MKEGPGEQRQSSQLWFGAALALPVGCCIGLPLLVAAGLSIGLSLAILAGAIVGIIVLVALLLGLLAIRRRRLQRLTGRTDAVKARS